MPDDDFSAFYREVHGYDPFNWQKDLTRQVLAEGRWPDLIDVPTGLGKTSLLDIAVFVTAASGPRGQGASGPGRRRCLFVVDRRLVVDEAYEHAKSLADALDRATAKASAGEDQGVTGRVAAGLRRYAPHAPGPLLPVTRMRGGVTWTSAWLDRPDRPGIVLGTVDQVGSRLLFRGYGTSPRRWSIDAALIGTDALLLVDEAHLATALLTTVEAIRDRDHPGVPSPGLEVVRLSATGRARRHRYALDLDAHREGEAGRRLTAAKRLTLRQTTAKDCPRLMAATAVDAVTSLLTTGSSTGFAPTALVVCNTVDRARAVHQHLIKLAGAKDTPDIAPELLIGRSRPIDRTVLCEEVKNRFGTGRGPGGRPAVLVATQTVEVGVNLDVDALVTESASWDALVQRLGRVNRLGLFVSQRFPARKAASAVVVHDGQLDGPVYGTARDTTWTALTALAANVPSTGLDVSPLACRALSDQPPLSEPACRLEDADVPVLLSPTLDAWVRTAPPPLNDPPIGPFLHGFAAGPAGVQVAWREGLTSDDPLDDPFGDDEGAEQPSTHADALLTQLPPRASELVEVPFLAVRQWMAGQSAVPVSDVESAADGEAKARQVRDPFRVLAQRSVRPRSGPGRGGRRGSPDQGADTTVWRWINAEELRPGDLVVVPVERGGLDRYGWAPDDRSRVQDASEAATFRPGRGRRDGVLRLDRRLAGRLGLDGVAAEAVTEAVGDVLTWFDQPDPDDRPSDGRLADFASTLLLHLPDSPVRKVAWDRTTWSHLRQWAQDSTLRVVDVPDPDTINVVDSYSSAPPPTRLLVGSLPTDSPVSTDGTPVPLATHHAGVRQRARQIAEALALDPALIRVIEDAAGWHDLGKSEERFQTMLHDGDPYLAAIAPEPLAKSGMDPADQQAWLRARQRSGLPRGARHEAWSMALVREHLRHTENLRPDTPYQGDLDLLLHLVASHHGHARPFLPLVTDPSPRAVQARIDDDEVSVPSEDTVPLDHPARFARLNDRYGRWGLALLESIVRCADTTVSGEGS
ncbi:MAG: CRISPR-associated endonuclease/helicase Cas3 [Actinomycetota bacterium]|nr:CRISPR-associated endonuclease/helicase Cas3 [Actinomycetota bacterium]